MPGLGEVGVDMLKVGTPPTRIVYNVGRNSNFLLVVAQAITASHYQLVVESTWTPGKPDLWSEVILLRVPGISLPNGQAC